MRCVVSTCRRRPVLNAWDCEWEMRDSMPGSGTVGREWMNVYAINYMHGMIMAWALCFWLYAWTTEWVFDVESDGEHRKGLLKDIYI